MLNVVVVQGRPTTEIELKYAGSGKPYCQFNLAIDSGQKDPNGDNRAYFPRCVAWEKTAEFLANHIKKGALIGLDGKLQTHNYETKSGEKRSETTILINHVHFCEKKPREDPPPPPEPPSYMANQNQAPTPSAPSTPHIPQNDINMSDLNEFQEIIPDGDLPF